NNLNAKTAVKIGSDAMNPNITLSSTSADFLNQVNFTDNTLSGRHYDSAGSQYISKWSINSADGAASFVGGKIVLLDGNLSRFNDGLNIGGGKTFLNADGSASFADGLIGFNSLGIASFNGNVNFASGTTVDYTGATVTGLDLDAASITSGKIAADRLPDNVGFTSINLTTTASPLQPGEILIRSFSDIKTFDGKSFDDAVVAKSNWDFDTDGNLATNYNVQTGGNLIVGQPLTLVDETGTLTNMTQDRIASATIYSVDKDSLALSVKGGVHIGTTNMKHIFGSENSRDDVLLFVEKGIATEDVTYILKENWKYWPDYVFEEDYKLDSLDDLEAYIKEHKHLPGVISQQEVKENGVSGNEMNITLLKKIEELTLYTIEQDNKLQDQETLNATLLKSLRALEVKVDALSNNK
ncbi:hypothetical protein V8G61_15125, partial [Gaetbulibacter sp. M240]